MDHEENDMKKLFQAIYKPVVVSPEFKDELLKQLTTEVNTKTEVLAIPLWKRPKLWVAIAAVLVVAAIGYGIWLPLTSAPTIIPPNMTPVTPSATPPAASPVTPPLTTPTPTPATTLPTPTPLTPIPSAVATGILEVRVTDAPTEHEVSTIELTIANIAVHKADGKNGWFEIIKGPDTFDLLKLLEDEEVLGEKEIDAGHYTQIRLDVKTVEANIDGEDRDDIVLPSGKLKIVGSFDINADKKTILTLDFDAEESLVFAGNGKVIFKPVIKLIITEED